MPPCKNDSTRSYDGTEPSPKGLGYCAHSEKLGTIKKGKDGKQWIVSETKNGTKRWTKYNKNTEKTNSKKYDFNSGINFNMDNYVSIKPIFEDNKTFFEVKELNKNFKMIIFRVLKYNEETKEYQSAKTPGTKYRPINLKYNENLKGEKVKIRVWIKDKKDEIADIELNEKIISKLI